MKKLLVLVVAMMFSVGAFAGGVAAKATDAKAKTEKAAPLTPEEIQKQIDEKKAALETETDAKAKAALEKEIKDLEKKLPKKKAEDKKAKKTTDEE